MLTAVMSDGWGIDGGNGGPGIIHYWDQHILESICI